MKRIILALLVISLLSCIKTSEKREWALICSYNNNWTSTTIHCDSLQMISTTEAFVYIDGKKIKIVGESLRPVHR